MVRGFVFIVALFATPALAAPNAALSQITPGDAGAGTKLGLAATNNSGEVGTVTLLERHTGTTLVVIEVASEPTGREQPARIRRGHACSDGGLRPVAYGLAPVVNGISKTLVNAPAAKLLSGNYLVDVRGVSCGELYQ